MMEKRKITAREIMKDVRAGLTDKDLMDKYNLSAQGLQSVFNKLIKAGVLSQSEMEDRVPVNERTVDLGLFICPACGNIQGKEFVKCPRCGFDLPNKSRANEKESKITSSTAGTVVEDNVEAPKPIAKPVISKPSPELYNIIENMKKSAAQCKAIGIAGLLAYLGVFAVALIASYSMGTSLLGSMLMSIIVGIPVLITGAMFLVIMKGLGESLQAFSDSIFKIFERIPKS